MRVVADIEVYHNIFTCTFVKYDGEEKWVFEISERKNQLVEFVEFVLGITYLISFNGVHYDSPIIMYIVKNVSNIKKEDWNSVTERIKSLSDTIINDDSGANYKTYSKYKYPPYCQIDLFMYWSKLTRVSRKLSLKSFAINLNWYRVQELPIHHNAQVRVDQIDALLDYNLNDVLVTKSLAHYMKPDINLRMAARARYGFECLSWDDVKLGLAIIIKRYCDRTGLDPNEVKALRTYRENINIGDLILPIVNFKEADISYRQYISDKRLMIEFKSFYGLWQYLKTLVVNDTKSISCRVLYEGLAYDIKSGGLHSYHNAEVVIPNGKKYKDKDVSSMYPTISAMWGIGPEHLGPEAPEELDVMRVERLTLKANGLGKSNDAEMAKKAMNGGWYGNMNNEYTPMYDPQGLLGTTINGQLMLLMFCEKLIEIGAVIDMVNTDGVTIIYDPNLHDEVERVSKEWEQLVRMELETVTYLKVVRKDINNYLAFYEDKGEVKVKEKGMFLTNPPIDMSHDFLVIPKAIKAYYQYNTPIEEFIMNHKEIYDFCGSMKCDKSYKVFHNGKETQRLNRYFVTRTGAYLYKSKDGVKMMNMLKDIPVKLFNDYYDVPNFVDYGIDYRYYIAKVKEIINELEPTQTSLFQ